MVPLMPRAYVVTVVISTCVAGVLAVCSAVMGVIVR